MVQLEALRVEKILNNAIAKRDFFRPSTRMERFRLRLLRSLLIALLVRVSKLSGDRVSVPVTATTFWGDPMRVLVPDGASIFLWGLIDGEELNLTRFFCENLAPGDVVIDIGAHFGFFTLLAAALVGRTGHVHAFEPTPRTASILKANVAGKENVTVNQMAAWKESGALELLDFGPRASVFNTVLRQSRGSPPSQDVARVGTRTKVEATSLDDYCRRLERKPSMIKLDAEGAEYEILLGSQSVLKSKPVLAVEVWGSGPHQKTAGDLIDLLRPYGYKPYRLQRGEPRPFRSEDSFDFANLIFSAA